MAAYGGRWFGPGEVGDLMKEMKGEIEEAREVARELNRLDWHILEDRQRIRELRRRHSWLKERP